MKRNRNRLFALIVIIMVISSSLTVNAADLYQRDAASPFICAAAPPHRLYAQPPLEQMRASQPRQPTRKA